MPKAGNPCSATASRSNSRTRTLVPTPIPSMGLMPLVTTTMTLRPPAMGEPLRTHPVLGVLFNQRGGLGPAALPPCDLEGSQDWAAAQG